MLIQVKTPELSESVSSGSLLDWRRQVGEKVRRDEPLADLETDKVILEVPSPSDGVLVEIRIPAGGEVKAGEVLAVIDTEAQQGGEVAPANLTPAERVEPVAAGVPAAVASDFLPPRLRARQLEDHPGEAPAPLQVGANPTSSVPPIQIPSSRVTPCDETLARNERRVPMSRLRQRIAERLKEAQNTAAMLTTFNEINMQPVMELRKRYQARFQQEHGVKLGLMSFFTKAASQALKAFPLVNASLEGRDIIYHDFYDIGVAVSSERGLVVPVLRNADHMSFAQIEANIADFAKRANSLELTIEELEGGTFTISNGGIFGSMLSTPILNPPQSAVLGLHKIQDRPIAENGQVVIRPMMYVALSYDHRLIDGREAVSFLKSIKDALEDPASLLLEL